MKLISLNTWGATQGQIFFEYIKQQSVNTDVFCFQEVFSADDKSPEISAGAYMQLFQKLQTLLPGFTGVFSSRSTGYNFLNKVDFLVEHGLAVFVRSNINIVNLKVENLGSLTDLSDPVEGKTIAQILTLNINQFYFNIINYHGPAQPGDKLDNEQRIEISKKLKSIWEILPEENKILCGDFNLMPDTQSIKILENCGFNLIRDYNIQNTRNEISWAKYHNRQSFADFIFISKSIKVKSFTVPYNLVSDHLPMIFEFEI